MPYTTLELITNAFYKSQIVSREFGTVSGIQKSVGLSSVNKLIADKTFAIGAIPYYKELDFVAVINQERYFIEDLITIDTLNFYMQSVRFAMTQVGRDAYFGSPRADNVTSLPYIYHVEPEFGGANLFIYFKPDQAYPMKIWGKFRLTEVAYNTDLSLSYDLFFIDYLEFLLADRLCTEYSFDTPPNVQKELTKFNIKIKNMVGPLDTTAQKISSLNSQLTGDIYAQANIGKGWYPG